MRTLAKKLAALLLATAILASSAPSALAELDLENGETAVVAYTDSVRVRAGTGTEFEILTTAPQGAAVTVIAGPIAGDDGNSWYGVNYNGTIGYIVADFLTRPENAPAASAGGGGTSQYAATGGGYTLTISGTGGDGARMRDGADITAAIILTIPENEDVTAVGSPLSSDGYAWYPVSYIGHIGYVAGDFLGSGTAASVVAQTAPRNSPSFQPGAHVQVSGTGGDGLRIRGEYGMDGGIVGHAPAGAVLAILGGPYWDGADNSWYGVDYDGLSGYAAAGYLTRTDEALSTRQMVAAPATPAPAPVVQPRSAPAPSSAAAPAPPSSASRGQALVDAAARYLGYPYAWAGVSPGGFDCSGFTMYVADLALGYRLGRDTGAQLGAGVAVDTRDLQPGDLVFFVNTYQAGLSHVGIYIGGGRMIGAASERTGVALANIWDSYWGPRFYAARRL